MVVKRESERGIALMIVLMVLMLLSALMIGFMANVMSDTRSGGVDRDETQAYAVAHAGMEKLTSDLAALFKSDYSPGGQQISDVAAKQPTLPGFTYTDPSGASGYKVQYTAKTSTGTCPAACSTVNTPSTLAPVPDDPTTGTTIAAGPYQGFKGLVTHYNIMVTARSASGSEVRMRRELQTVAVPVFQFGLFSESSLSFHSSSDFNFGGRVHTNGDLFVAGGNGSPAGQLWLGDKVTAVGEVVRKYLDNGVLSTSLYPGAVNMAKGTGTYRVLSASANSGRGEGSVTGNAPATVPLPSSGNCPVATCLNDPVWTNLSVGTYNGYIRNGRTGARRLDLPLVTDGAEPIDLIRRPKVWDVPTSTAVNEISDRPLVLNQRYYKQASLRILLSDLPADITVLPGIVTGTAPTDLEDTAATFGPATKKVPLAQSLGTCVAGAGCYKSNNGTPLIGGVIKIEMLKGSDNTYVDVTDEILNLGIAGRNLNNATTTGDTAFDPYANSGVGNAVGGTATIRGILNGCLKTDPHPNAVIRLQRVKDVPSTSGNLAMNYSCGFDLTTPPAPTTQATDYWPMALYDAREGLRRDEVGANTGTPIYLGGVMYYVELDVTNLARWFRGNIGASGNQAKNDNNGFIVYFSDRRNNRNSDSATKDAAFLNFAETGEFGYEDIINKASPTGASDGALDATCSKTLGSETKPEANPEDVNYNCDLETYGAFPAYAGTYNSAPPGATTPLTNAARPLDQAGVTSQIVRSNRPIFFRRALKLVNGGNLPGVSGMTGLSIASENPVYVQGNYNTTATDIDGTATHIATAIIADAITLLSNNWNDIRSFSPNPIDTTAKPARTTGYRFAAVTGKNIPFQQPTGWTPETNFGMDGGAHNLLRQLEDWTANSSAINYRGSIVSFYYSRQAIGTFKCCQDTYKPNDRNYFFDSDFLLPDKLPPGTPMFRDVNTLTFRQLLRPNQ